MQTQQVIRSISDNRPNTAAIHFLQKDSDPLLNPLNIILYLAGR